MFARNWLCLCLTAAMLGSTWFGGLTQASQDSKQSWIAEEVEKKGFNLSMINHENYNAWVEFIEPTIEELDWNAVRWHHSLGSAVKEAKKLNRPILLWTMNGHPFGET